MSKSLGFSNMYNYGDFLDNNLLNNINNSGSLYAQNLPPNVLSDAVNYNPNYISDDELYKRMWNNIKEFEKVKYHPYLDTKGNITTGGGANINNYDDFMKVNFTVNGVPATDAQKLIAYHNLRKLSKEKMPMETMRIETEQLISLKIKQICNYLTKMRTIWHKII